MPKRAHEETKEDRWRRKMKKYEARLQKKANRPIVYSDEENFTIQETWETVQVQESLPYEQDLEWLPSNEDPASNAFFVEHTAPAFPAAEPAIPVSEPAIPVAEITTTEAPQVNATVITCDINAELLNALGKLEEETEEWGEPIFDDIAKRLKPLLLCGLKKDDKEALTKKYHFPKNVSLSKAPTLNAEISAMLSEQSRNRDTRLYNKQNQLGLILSTVTGAMSLLLHKNPNLGDILAILSDASKLIADSHYLETDTRRSLIIPLIDKQFIEPFKDRRRDNFLFGENLGDLVKNSRGVKKTGQLIQASASFNLNARGRPPRGRQQNHFANRGGGQQRPYRRRHGPYQQPPAPALMRRHPQGPPASRRIPPAASAPRTSAATTSDRSAARGTY